MVQTEIEVHLNSYNNYCYKGDFQVKVQPNIYDVVIVR